VSLFNPHDILAIVLALIIMKQREIYLLTILAVLISCNSNNSTGENVAGITYDSSTVSLNENNLVEAVLSYDSLILYIKNNKQIPCSYFESHGKGDLKCPLEQSILINEPDSYIIVKAMHLNQVLDSYPYYLCTFSKESAEMISFIPIGEEAEAVEPNVIIWESDNEFKMIEYSYELVEDEESGAYMRGEIKDSTVTEYRIDSLGEISQLIDEK
jgi:hypothetical protein